MATKTKTKKFKTEKELQKEVPHGYLVNIIEREKQIDEGKESLILSEELI
ncbi:MAG: hypothetical protein WCP39_07200 [Chlamydiota bacterium]